jgi:hypothetical protein
MFCCGGLFAGVIARAYLGVRWVPYVTIPLGVAGGLSADITIFRVLQKKETREQPFVDQPCCAILNLKKKKESWIATENYVQA